MIRTIDLNVTSLTYENHIYGIKMQYPSNWSDNYHNEPNSTGAIFFSPIDGPYSLTKEYRMLIGYSSAYGTGMPYAITIYQDNENRTWTKEILESALNGQSRILERELNPHFFENGNGYALLNLDLDSLNLPDQFYLYFAKDDFYIKNGRLCFLSDYTDFVSSPPPEYSISTTPGSLNNLRAGDEKDIQIQVKALMALPYNISFSTDDNIKGLDLKINPTEISGVPNGITTSDLHIKVLPTATAELHTFPIHANILLTPTVNLINSTSARINKDANFTITVLPPLTLGEIFTSFFNPQSGPGVVIFSILSIVSGLFSGKIIWKGSKKKQHKPLSVTIIAILTVFGGIVAILTSGFVAAAILGFFFVGIIIGTTLMIVGIAYFFMAYGLWKGKIWAWKITLILAEIGIILGTALIIVTDNIGVLVQYIGVVGFHIIINATVIYYLYRPDVKVFFGKVATKPSDTTART